MSTNNNKNNSNNNDDYEDDFENDTKSNNNSNLNTSTQTNTINNYNANLNANMNTKTDNTASAQSNANTNNSNTNYFAASKQIAANVTANNNPNNPNNIANSVALQRASLEYQVAWELEMWRRTEQIKIEQQWKLNESKRMLELESEFKKAELYRESIHQSKIKEIANLEKKLQNALFDCQQHEKQLKFKEQEFNTKTQLINNDIGRKHEEAELVVKRMKEQLQHQNNIQKRITSDMQSQIDTLKSSLHVAEAKLKETESIYLDYKSKISKSTIGELRMQLAEKELLIKSLNYEISKLSNDKLTLENRLSRCLDEIARLNSEAEDKEKQRLALERKDIQTMKMVYLAKQQSQGLRHDQEQLEEIRKDLAKFRQGAESNYLKFGDEIKQQPPPISNDKLKQPPAQFLPYYVNNYAFSQPENIEQQQFNQENIPPNANDPIKLFQQSHPALLTQQQQQQSDNNIRIDLSAASNSDQKSNTSNNNLQPPRPNTSPRPTSPKSPKNRVISPESTPKKSPKSNNKRSLQQQPQQTSAPTSPAAISKSRPLHSHLNQAQHQQALLFEQQLQQSQANQNPNNNNVSVKDDNNNNSDNNNPKIANNEHYISSAVHEYKPQSPDKSVVHELPMPTQHQIAALDYIKTHPDESIDTDDNKNPLITDRSAGGAITSRVRKGTAGTGVAAARAARLAAQEAGAKAREARLNRKPKYSQ